MKANVTVHHGGDMTISISKALHGYVFDYLRAVMAGKQEAPNMLSSIKYYIDCAAWDRGYSALQGGLRFAQVKNNSVNGPLCEYAGINLLVDLAQYGAVKLSHTGFYGGCTAPVNPY